MRRTLNAVAAIAAFSIAGVASAQGGVTQDLTPVNVTVRLGVALPLDSALTDVGSTLIDLGAEYTIPTPLIKGGETYLSVDYWAKGIRGDKGSVVPLFLNQRWYRPGNQIRRGYLFLGAGVDFIDTTSSNTAVGLRGGIGQELGEHIIAEVSGWLSDRAGNARANAVTFSLGYRF